MMQQPPAPHDQVSAQQLQQQMVLCPVRVVYETQILVQPGEQIQPNQTLFINPQNPPPWAQNRTVQNPIIYVQQMPNNMMSSIPQHIDQNQLFLHQYQNYQHGVQVIPQQMVQNIERQNVHIPNMIHQNMLPNYQANINPNVGSNVVSNVASNVGQNISSNVGQNNPGMQERTQQTNYAQIHPNTGAVQIQAQTHNLVNNPVNRPNEMSQHTQQQHQFANQKIEMKQMYNVGHVNQAQNVARPQILTVNPMQNVPQNNMQQFTQMRPIKTESVGSQITPPTFVNATQNTMPRIRKIVPNTMNKLANPNIAIRPVQAIGQAYRPIQPRTQQFRPNIPNYTVQMQTQANSMPTLTANLNAPIQNVPISNANYVSANSPVMRKRKSESPDEIHKKMAAIQVNMPPKQNEVQRNVDTSNSYKKESSPIVFPSNSMTVSLIPPSKVQSMDMPLLTPNAPCVRIDKEIPKRHTEKLEANNSVLLKNAIQNSNAETNNSVLLKNAIQNSNAKDKLIRNTVFTQARGRVLAENDIVKEIVAPPTPVLEAKPTPILEVANPVKLENEVKPTEVVAKVEIKTDKMDVDIKPEVPKQVETKVEVKEEKKEISDMNVSLNNTNNKGMFPVERSVKQERDYILTHVLDGIVIQESNVAFPIREPLIKRTQPPRKVNDTKEIKEEKQTETHRRVKKEEKTKASGRKCSNKEKINVKHEVKEKSVKIEESTEIPRELESSLINEEDKKENSEEENPFSRLKPTTVKSWTTQELASHLGKYKWDDTASLLMEHEIDGESLCLVSKGQLQHIGVKEGQAELICAFVKGI